MHNAAVLSAKAVTFRALHSMPDAFLIPNPWDVGSAKILTALGFKALATTSAGYALTKGLPDNTIEREETLKHIHDVAAATSLPVSADLGNGLGNTPTEVAETLALAVNTGIVGASIEDATGDKNNPIYPIGLATERIMAAVETCKKMPHPFMLTARADNYFNRNFNLADTIKRLQQYQEAGADVLFAPGVTKREDIQSILSSIDKPLNVLAGINGFELSVKELSEMGVKRISLGASLAKAAFIAFINACMEINDSGTFNYTSQAMNYETLIKLLKS